MFESGSIFRQFFVPKHLDINDPVFQSRLRKLDEKIRKDYDVTPIKGGLRCTAKKEATPGFILTQETVLFVMKFLEID